MGLLVIGAGGHGKVVMDILLGNHEIVLGYVDDDETTWGSIRLNQPVLGAVERWREFNASGLVMGIGSSRVRKTLVEGLGVDAPWESAVHPSATSVAPSAQLGTGVVIAAGAIVNPDAVIGDFAIINTGATVDHDCIIGRYAHIAPGTNLGRHCARW
ncbi:MAG: transferase [Anaerolineae bacterium]